MEVFPLDTLKTSLLIVNLTQEWMQSRPFFPESVQLFRFSEQKQGRPIVADLLFYHRFQEFLSFWQRQTSFSSTIIPTGQNINIINRFIYLALNVHFCYWYKNLGMNISEHESKFEENQPPANLNLPLERWFTFS